MKRAFFLAVALFATFAAHAATISGTVVNEAGAPLPSMTVAAYTLSGTLQASGATTASGTYALTLPAGAYHLLAYDPAGSYATSFYADAESFETSVALTVSASQNLTGIHVRLVRAGFVAGKVVSSSGAPLVNVTVAAYNASGTRRGFTTTNANGNFTLALPPGNYRIAAYDVALNYATTVLPNALAIAQAQTSVVNLILVPAAKLSGRISDRATNAPLANMHVVAYAADGTVAGEAFTGSDGRYALAARPGALRVVVDDPAGVYATTYMPDAESFSTETPFNAAAGQSLTIDATLVRGGRLAGRVTARANGTPLAGITAVAYNASGTIRAFATTDASGAYSIVVPPGDYRVGVFDTALVYLPQFYANATQFAVANVVHAGSSQNIGGIDFSLVQGARITGRVTAANGAVIPGATVAAYDVNGRLIASTTADASGNYVLLLAPGSVKLLAFDSALQYATGYYLGATTFESTQSLTLFEGQPITADFALPAAGRINGTVTDIATRAPLAGMHVIVYDASFARIADTFTDAGGTFRVAAPAGTYSVAAADDAHRYSPAFYAGTVTLSAGQEVGP
ncbi:MAG: carboxypeptidase-like regulatory domain-containing protein, partial [Acidobacteriota bacterium]|nr:carboxypeptidase-like regulatory domain-containing protein [Acidobacteriota bacterium]